MTAPQTGYVYRLGDVKIIGVGGVGGIVARYASLFLASHGADGRLVLIDGDAFEPGNASRMLFGSHGNKAEVVRGEILERLGDSELVIEAIDSYVTPETIETLIRDGDTVLLCVDNHATRKLVSDFCMRRRRNVSVISGGNDGVGPDSSGIELHGTAGNCQVYLRCDGRDVTPSLAAFHPEIERPADRRPDDVPCTELAASVPQIVFANLTAAASMLNAFWALACGRLRYVEVAFDIEAGRMQPIPLPLPSPAGQASGTEVTRAGSR